MQISSSDPNLSTLLDRIQKEKIDLQPDFQRGEVWSIKKKQRLIDTLLRDWHVPPIHLVKKEENGGEVCEVLDGQQRLAAIWGFVKDDFPLESSPQPIGGSLEDCHGKYWSELDEKYKDALLDRTLRVLTISQCDPAEAAELFYRLNQPTSLTAPEQRNAYFGDVRDQVRKIVGDMKSMGAESKLMGFSNARMSYDDVIAKCLITLDLNSLDKKLTAGFIADKYRDGHRFTQRSEQLVRLGMEMFLKAAKKANDSRRFNKASSYSWIVFLSKVAHYINIEERGKFVDFVNGFYCPDRRASSKSDLTFFLLNSFTDRATSRVADTSSVKIRDFCIHALATQYLTLSDDILESLKMKKIIDIYPDMESALAEDGSLHILSIVEYLEWGTQIIDDKKS